MSLADASKVLTTAMAGSQRGAKLLGIQVQSVTTAEDKIKLAFKDHTTEAYKLAEANAKLTDKQMTAAKVIDLVRQKTKGQAEAFSQTAAGGMAQFHAQLESLGESIGKALIPALTKLSQIVADAAGWFAEHKRVAEALVAALAVLSATLIGVSIATKLYAAATKIATAASVLFEAQM